MNIIPEWYLSVNYFNQEFVLTYANHVNKCYIITGKKQLHLSPELQLLTRIVHCGSQLWAVKHTWSTGKAEVATRDGKFAKASDKCYTQQKGIVP